MTAVLLGLVGALASSRLGFRTSFAELLPDDDPGVVTLRATQKRMGDLTLLLVGVRSPDLKANERYAEALTSYLRTLPPAICEFATYHVRDIHQFIDANRWLYAPEQDLIDGRERLRREVARRKNPLIADLGLSDPGGGRRREAPAGTADAGQDEPGGPLPRRAVSQPRRHHGVGDGPATRWPAGRERRRGPAERHQRLHPSQPAGEVPPADGRRGHRADRHGDPQPAGDGEGSGEGGRPVRPADPAGHRAVFPPGASGAVRDHPGDAGHVAGLRRRLPGVRLPDHRHQLPGVVHHGQRHQLRHRGAGPLSRSAPAGPPDRRGGQRSHRQHVAQHGHRRHRLGGQLPVAAGDQLPRLLPVRPHRRRRLSAGLADHLHGHAGDVAHVRSPGRSPNGRYAAGDRCCPPWPGSSNAGRRRCWWHRWRCPR